VKGEGKNAENAEALRETEHITELNFLSALPRKEWKLAVKTKLSFTHRK
jgi:hypothetical protein